MERLQPDLTLIDIELHEYIFAAYALKARFALAQPVVFNLAATGPAVFTD